MKVMRSISATIRFTLSEASEMSNEFCLRFIFAGMAARVFKYRTKRNKIYYEIRYRRDGYNISVSHKDLKKAKQLFIEETYSCCSMAA